MPRELHKVFFEEKSPAVFITGGAGFVGSRLCEALVSKSCKVVCIDNWKVGIEQNLKNLKKNKNFILVEQEITRPLPKDLPKPDYIFHLAGLDSFLSSQDVPLEILSANSTAIFNLLKLAQGERARFLFVSTIEDFLANRFAEQVIGEFAKKGVDVRVVRVGQVFGPRMFLGGENLIAKLIRQAVYSRNLEVPGSGRTKIYPVYVDDVVDALIFEMFSAGAKGKTFTVLPESVTQFAFTEMVQKASGKNLEITFVDEETSPGQEVLPTGENIYKPKISLDEGILKTLSWFGEHKSQVPQPKEKIQAVITQRRFAGLGLIFGAIAIALFLFFVLPFLQLLAGTTALYQARAQIDRGSMGSAKALALIASNLFSASQDGFSLFAPLFPLPQELIQNTENLEIASRIVARVARAANLAEEITEGILGKEPFNPKPASSELSLEFASLSQDLAFLQAEIGSGKNLLFLSEEDLSKAREVLGSLSKIFLNLPQILGADERKTYLVLFQNNMELRPTGGFIGSFGLATFEGGRLIDFQVQDVYSADGQLVGHVEPPPKLKEHLGEANWFLRDSNWDPDFPTSAVRAEWFIDKELGRKVDGVFAVDLSFAKKIIEQLGKMEIRDFAETITPDNLYERTQYRAEANWFAGSRQKADFLTALSRTLFEKIIEAPKTKRLALAKAAFSSLEESHLLLFFHDQQIQEAISNLFWDGSIKSPSCPKEAKNCKADSIFLVESNVGVNKANLYLLRNISLDIFLSQEKIIHELSISYSNKSPGDVWPAGPYKSYTRFFAPKNSKFLSATLFNPESGKKQDLELDLSEEKGKSIAGFLFAVAPGESQTLEVLWETESDLSFEEEGQFLFYWQKQAGVDEEPIVLRFHNPGGFSLNLAPKPSLISGNLVGYNTTLVQDFRFFATWQGK